MEAKDRVWRGRVDICRTSGDEGIDHRQIWKTLDLPLDDPSKQQGQSILYAVEELYYLQQFGKAVEVVELALKGILGSELRTILLDYEERCLAKQQGHLKP